MITPITLNYILGGTTLYLLFKIWEYSRMIKSPEVRYVDISGIINNPPTFQEVWKNQTINFKLGKEAIRISHMPAMDCISYISKISACYIKLDEYTKYMPNGKLDTFINNQRYINIYRYLILLIYKLSKPHAKKKGVFRKELFKRGKKDTQFIMSITEQILDYWKYMGKQRALLAQGKTLRMIHGDRFTWDKLKMDGQGKILKTPRYVKY